MILMSHTKLTASLLAATIILSFSGRQILAAERLPASKTLPSKVLSSQQLAAIDCSGVSGLPGISDLCNALDNGLTVLGSSITDAIGQIANNFLTMLSKNSWDIIFKYILSPFFQGMGNLLWQGIDPTTYNPQSSRIDQQIPQKIGIAPFQLVAAVYQNPPDLGTMSSLAEVINGNILGFKTSFAAAATPGRVRLNPIFSIWEGVRNISYLMITLVLVAYGFMVMLRQKIDPRTVITVQSAIPRLAIGLLMIAFSYTIASLVVDIGQVSLSTVGYFFNNLSRPACVLIQTPCLPYPYLESPMGLFTVGQHLDFNAPTFKIPIIDGLVSMILGLVVWYIFFQVFFALITNYAQIFVKAAIGPVLIAIGIIPSQNDNIKKWIMGMLANVLVFPGIFFILNLAVYINNYESSFTLPDPLVQTDVKNFIILGLVVIASKVPAIIEEALEVQASGAVSRAGADVQQVARKIPLVGGFLG